MGDKTRLMEFGVGLDIGNFGVDGADGVLGLGFRDVPQRFGRAVKVLRY